MNHLTFVSRSSKIGAFLRKLSEICLEKMKPAVLLCNNYFLAMALFFYWAVNEAHSCDTKWIRLVYMMSCGKKKRESVWARNDTFFENLPSDFDGAFRYFKEKDPSNPMLNEALLYEILKEDDENSSRTDNVKMPKLLIFEEETGKKDGTRGFGSNAQEVRRPGLALIKKLFPKKAKGNLLGIRGFPEQWDLEEIIDDKINENHRREIDRLIEECCKVPPVTTCNGNTFSGACK